MTFNFTKTEEVGVTRTRAKRVTINENSITYELENKIVMKDGANKFYRIGNLLADTTITKTIEDLDIDTGVVVGSLELTEVMADMKLKIKYILKKYTNKDFEVKTEAGTSYYEVKDIFIDNDFNTIPSVNFSFNEVIVLANGNEMRLPKDNLFISMQMDITKTDTVKTFLSLYRSLFNIMADKANSLTEDEISNLV